jgi:hypothetical protein
MSNTVKIIPGKPTPLQDFERIPGSIKTVGLKIWVPWCYAAKVNKDGIIEKWDKPPAYRKNGQLIKISTSSPENLMNFDQAMTMVREKRADGLGIVLHPECRTGFVGIDGDNMSDPYFIGLLKWARALGMYVQRSPSGRGWHIIGLGSNEGIVTSGKKQPIDIPATYITMTGYEAEGDPFVDIQDLANEVYAEMAKKKKNGEGGTIETGKIPPRPDIETVLAKLPNDVAIQMESGFPMEIWEDSSAIARQAAIILRGHGLDASEIACVLSEPGFDAAQKALKNRNGNIDSAYHWAYRYQGLKVILDKVCAVDIFDQFDDPDQIDHNSPYSFAASTADLKLLDVKIEYVVEGLIPQGMNTLFYAPSGLGKSTVATQLVQAVRDGTPFLGLPTTKSEVFYLDYENPLATIVERLRKVGGTEPFRLWHYNQDPPPPPIDSKRRDILFALSPGTVLVIDTLKAANDKDENSSTEMKPIFDFLKKLRGKGITTIILHHTTKGVEANYRGSGVIQDQSDHVLTMEKVKAPGSNKETDDEGVFTYKLYTPGKSRARSFKMYLSFDPGRELFVAVEDPAMEEMRKIRSTIAEMIQQNEKTKQSGICKVLKDSISEKNVITLLKRGEGKYWKGTRGEHNAIIYNLLPEFGSFSSYKEEENCQTGTGPFSGQGETDRR